MYPSVSNYDMYHKNHFCRNPVALFFCLPIVFLGSERRKTSFGRYWVVVFSGGGGGQELVERRRGTNTST